MPTPTISAITTTAGLYGSRSGPYRSGGALYCVLMGTDGDGIGTGQIEVYKSSDDGSTWNMVETVACQEQTLYYGTDFHGGIIYIAHWEPVSDTDNGPGLAASFVAAAQLALFDCSTDSIVGVITGGPIGTTSETHPGGFGTGDKLIHCAYRPASNDVVVALHQSIPDGGTYYDAPGEDPLNTLIGRVVVSVVTGGAFGAAIDMLPAPGIGVQQSWRLMGITRGADGLAHIMGCQQPTYTPLVVTPTWRVAHVALLADNTVGIDNELLSTTTQIADLQFAGFPVSRADGSVVYATYGLDDDTSVIICGVSEEDPVWETTAVSTASTLALGINAAGSMLAMEIFEPSHAFTTDLPSREATDCTTYAAATYTISPGHGFYACRGDGGVIYTDSSTTSYVYFFPIDEGTEQNVTGVSGIITAEAFGVTHGVRGGGEPPGCGEGPPITPVPGVPPTPPGTPSTCGTIGYAY